MAVCVYHLFVCVLGAVVSGRPVCELQISGRHYSNATKHGIWPPEDGRIKRTETCRGLFVFANILVFLSVKVNVF